MTDDYIEDDEIEAERDQAGLTPAERRKLEKRAKQAEELEQRALAAERKLALREAGLDLSPRQVSALLKEHGDGPIDADSFKQTAQELGWYTPPAEEIPEEDVGAITRITSAAAGEAPPLKVDPADAAKGAPTQEEYVRRYAEAGGRVAIAE